MAKVTKIQPKLPVPVEVGVTVPRGVDQELFQQGWEHGLVSNRLTKREHLKASFREGFRAAKMYLRDLLKKQNVTVMPMKARMKFKVKD